MVQRVIGVDYDSHAVHLAILTGGGPHMFRVPVGDNLVETLGQLRKLLKNFRGAFVVIEAPIYIQNPRTSFKLARVQTLACLACERVGLEYKVLESTRWKKLALGRARMKKQEILEAMQKRFGDIISDSHFADATGLALAGKKLLEEKERESAV